MAPPRNGKGGNKSPKAKIVEKETSAPKAGAAKHCEPEEDDEFVVEAMQDLSNLKIKNDTDKIAYNVAKVLIPFLGKTVRSSVESYSVQKPDFEKAKAIYGLTSMKMTDWNNIQGVKMYGYIICLLLRGRRLLKLLSRH